MNWEVRLRLLARDGKRVVCSPWNELYANGCGGNDYNKSKNYSVTASSHAVIQNKIAMEREIRERRQ